MQPATDGYLAGFEISLRRFVRLGLKEPADIWEVITVDRILLALDQILRPFEDRDDRTLLLLYFLARVCLYIAKAKSEGNPIDDMDSVIEPHCTFSERELVVCRLVAPLHISV